MRWLFDTTARQSRSILPSVRGINGSAVRVVVDAGMFAVGEFAYKVVALVTLPLLARLMSPDELGILDLAAIVGSSVSVVTGLGTDNAVARYEKTAKDVWGAALFLTIAAGALVVVTALILEGIGVRLVGGADAGLVPLAAAYGVATAVLNLGLNAVRLGPGSRSYIRYSVATLIGQSSVALAFAILMSEPVPWILTAWAFIAVLAGVTMLSRHRPHAFRLGVARLWVLLSFGLPFVPGTLTWLVGDIVIRNGIAMVGDPSDLGAYSIGHRVANVLPLLATGLSLAWHPFLYRATREHRAAAAPVVSILVVGTLSAVAVTFGLLAPEIVLVVGGERYLKGGTVIGPLAIGFVGYGILTLLAGLAGVEARTIRIAVASTVGLMIQVLGASLLIPIDGIRGGAVAAMLGFAAALLVLSPYIRHLSLRTRDLAGIGLVLFITVCAGYWGSLNPDSSLGSRVLVMGVALGVIALGVVPIATSPRLGSAEKSQL